MPLSPRTPYLVVDVAVLEANVDRVARAADEAGVALRPHVKTHKCAEIAARQVAAGASGITVATVGEAEVFVETGFADVFVAYPVWVDEERAARIRALREKARRGRRGRQRRVRPPPGRRWCRAWRCWSRSTAASTAAARDPTARAPSPKPRRRRGSTYAACSPSRATATTPTDARRPLP